MAGNIATSMVTTLLRGTSGIQCEPAATAPAMLLQLYDMENCPYCRIVREVLTELGLPRNEYVTALVAFNVGVELGQLAVIALGFFAVGLWFRQRDWYRRGIVVPASLVIALIGAYWTVERVTGWG